MPLQNINKTPQTSLERIFTTASRALSELDNLIGAKNTSYAFKTANNSMSLPLWQTILIQLKRSNDNAKAKLTEHGYKHKPDVVQITFQKATINEWNLVLFYIEIGWLDANQPQPDLIDNIELSFSLKI